MARPSAVRDGLARLRARATRKAESCNSRPFAFGVAGAPTPTRAPPAGELSGELSAQSLRNGEANHSRRSMGGESRSSSPVRVEDGGARLRPGEAREGVAGRSRRTARTSRKRGDRSGSQSARRLGGMASGIARGSRTLGATRRIGCSSRCSGPGAVLQSMLDGWRRCRHAGPQAIRGGRERVPGRCAHAPQLKPPSWASWAARRCRANRQPSGLALRLVRQRSGTRAYSPPGCHCAATPPLKGGAPPLARQCRSAVGAAPSGSNPSGAACQKKRGR